MNNFYLVNNYFDFRLKNYTIDYKDFFILLKLKELQSFRQKTTASNICKATKYSKNTCYTRLKNLMDKGLIEKKYDFFTSHIKLSTNLLKSYLNEKQIFIIYWIKSFAGDCFMSKSTLRNKVGMSQNTFNKEYNHLKQNGIIQEKKCGRLLIKKINECNLFNKLKDYIKPICNFVKKVKQKLLSTTNYNKKISHLIEKKQIEKISQNDIIVQSYQLNNDMKNQDQDQDEFVLAKKIEFKAPKPQVIKKNNPMQYSPSQEVKQFISLFAQKKYNDKDDVHTIDGCQMNGKYMQNYLMGKMVSGARDIDDVSGKAIYHLLTQQNLKKAQNEIEKRRQKDKNIQNLQDIIRLEKIKKGEEIDFWNELPNKNNDDDI